MTNANTFIEAIPHHPEADSFDFQKSWIALRHACKTYRFLILGICILTVALTILYVRIWPPVYVTTVTLAGESDKDLSRESFYQNWAVFRSDRFADEVYMITSAPVLSEVIRRLNLKDDDVYHTFFGYIRYWWVTSWVGQTYRRFKQWVFPHPPGPYDPSPEQVVAARVLQDFKSGVQLDRVMDTDVGQLVVRGQSPRVAEIAQTLVDVYFEQRRKRHELEAQDAYNALNVELQKAQQEVASIEQAMRRYYSENSLLLTFEKDKLDIGQAQILKATIMALTASIAADEETLQQIETELAQEPKEAVASRFVQANPVRDVLLQQLSALKLKRKQVMINYRPESREVAMIDQQIANVTALLNQESDTAVRQSTVVIDSHFEELRVRAATVRIELAGQRASLKEKQKQFKELETLLQTIPQKMEVVHDLNRDHDAAESKMAAIRQKMVMAAVARATMDSTYPAIRVVEPPAAPGEPAWPRTNLLLLISIAIGLVAGIVLAVVLDMFFGRVHRYRLASAGRELPIYAIVRRDPAAARVLPLLLGR
jgi:uncharacterized protein involved in exopolysaccharide biosynthesis